MKGCIFAIDKKKVEPTKTQMTMKRMMMMTVLALLTVLPVVAQYPRRSYGRPLPPRSAYARNSTPRSYLRSTDVYYGLRLGLGVSTVNSDAPFLDGGSPKAGLNLSMVAGFQLAPATPVYLETGLLYAEKGGKGSYGGHSFTYNLDYLELPLLMKYRYDIDRLTSIQPFAGVYASVGIGGKIKDFNERQAYSSFDSEGFKRCDAGLRLGCGLQFDHLYAELGYDLGLANVSHDYFDTGHTGSFFANIGVNF